MCAFVNIRCHPEDCHVIKMTCLHLPVACFPELYTIKLYQFSRYFSICFYLNELLHFQFLLMLLWNEFVRVSARSGQISVFSMHLDENLLKNMSRKVFCPYKIISARKSLCWPYFLCFSRFPSKCIEKHTTQKSGHMGKNSETLVKPWQEQ